MSTNVQTALLMRVPKNTPSGKAKVIGTTLGDSLELSGFRNEAANNRELTAVGRANQISKHLLAKALPALAKARRQVAFGAAKLEKMRLEIRKRAIGEHDPLDHERRDFLRSQSANDRIKSILTNPTLRGAALRAPELVGVGGDGLDRAMQLAIIEKCPAESEALTVMEEAHAIHVQSAEVLQQEILVTPFVVEPNGSVRQLHTPQELQNLLDKSVPQATTKQIALEEAEVDQVGEA